MWWLDCSVSKFLTSFLRVTRWRANFWFPLHSLALSFSLFFSFSLLLILPHDDSGNTVDSNDVFISIQHSLLDGYKIFQRASFFSDGVSHWVLHNAVIVREATNRSVTAHFKSSNSSILFTIREQNIIVLRVILEKY